MDDMVSFAVNSFVSIFVIVDPVGTIPLYLVMTQGMTDEAKKKIVARASTVCCTVLVLFALGGDHILKFFHITLFSFRIAAGVILFVTALQMLHARISGTRTSPQEEKEGVEKEDISVVPLAIPLLSGPGAISAVMVWSGEGAFFLNKVILIISIVIVSALTAIVLYLAMYIQRVLKQTGINIFVRLMGLILAAISVQFVISGLREAIITTSPA